jgi:hypothetical protein
MSKRESTPDDHANSTPATAVPDGSTTEKPTSQKRIEANRKNALRSTGPKSVLGKKMVSRNAIKHSLLAREVVILSGDGAECLKEFHKLCDQLVEYYRPANIMQAKEVEKIACALWRLARVQRAETGEIRKTLDSFKSARSDAAVDRFDSYQFKILLPRSKGGSGSISEAAAGTMPEEERLMYERESTSLLNLELLCSTLIEIRERIKRFGELSQADYESFTLNFGHNHLFLEMCPVQGKSQDQGQSNEHGRRANKEAAVFLIDKELKLFETLKEERARKDKFEEVAEGMSLSLPSAKAADKILRYESHLDRRLQRAMDRLERMQRQLGGEPLPLPVKVILSRN